MFKLKKRVKNNKPKRDRIKNKSISQSMDHKFEINKAKNTSSSIKIMSEVDGEKIETTCPAFIANNKLLIVQDECVSVKVDAPIFNSNSFDEKKDEN